MEAVVETMAKHKDELKKQEEKLLVKPEKMLPDKKRQELGKNLTDNNVQKLQEIINVKLMLQQDKEVALVAAAVAAVAPAVALVVPVTVAEKQEEVDFVLKVA